jgi:hypothetical protein
MRITRSLDLGHAAILSEQVAIERIVAFAEEATRDHPVSQADHG